MIFFNPAEIGEALALDGLNTLPHSRHSPGDVGPWAVKHPPGYATRRVRGFGGWPPSGCKVMRNAEGDALYAIRCTQQE